MLFNSYHFLVFFPIVCLLYFVLPKKIRWIWLLASSYYFYMCWNPIYLILIVISTILTYLCAIFVEKAEKNTTKKLIIALSVVLNIGILGYFKYTNFLVDSINSVFSIFSINPISRFDIVLPVGISFYTFQAIGYTIDVYRKDIDAEKNIFRYALFVSFFPQLVAGPIERSKNLMTQIRNEASIKVWDYKRITQGLTMMLWGFFMKMVISDRIAIIVNQIFGNYEEYHMTGLIVGSVSFAIQIYTDFNGYSTIAIGAAKVMGFELMENFNTPFFARSVGDMWRRWHVSMSSWFKDYIYIPLGGSRKGRLKKYRNLMITFIASGLWHGANWTYVLWGAINGFYQIVGDLLTPVKKKINKAMNTKTESFGYKLFQAAITFGLFCLSTIFFRSETITDGAHYIGRMFMYRDWWSIFDGSLLTYGLDGLEMNILVVSVLILFIVSVVRYKKSLNIAQYLDEQCLAFRWIVLIILIMFVINFGHYGPNFDSAQFIYFQF